ncbi:MAG: hypothetical protein COB15_03285 [Flavobacteriales bacterium]|nr:MAG: hypothetical protein COB15_03285 [Flavobacteriales bacterium]
MPIYIHLSNLILAKKTVEKKYLGGINQFRLDYFSNIDTLNQEDKELFSLVSMNNDELDIDTLIQKGISYSMETQTSDDFTIINRYGGALWSVSWISDNGIFAWHNECEKEKIDLAEKIANTPMVEINDLLETFQ